MLSSHHAGGGPWAMTGCCGNMWDLLTSVNDPDHCIRMAYVDHPDVLCKPSGWYVYKCCLVFLEVVRKSVPCALYREIRMRVTRMTMRAMCHCKMRATCSRREGFLQKQQFLASRSEVQNAKEDPPKKLESWKAFHFSSLKKFKSLGTRIPYYYKFHPLWTWANEAAYTNSGDLRFNKLKKLKALMQEKNQLDSPKIEKNRNSFVVWGHFLHHSFPINFPSNLPTCMHEYTFLLL